MSVEEGGREGGGGADTELKTKNPHVNVGKKKRCVSPKASRMASLKHPSECRLLLLRYLLGESVQQTKHNQQN